MKTIRLLLSAVTVLVTTLGMAQTTITPPYNPNADDIAFIQMTDLLAFLGIYGDEFYPAEILIDGQSLELYIQQLEEAAANAVGDTVAIPMMIPGTALGQILYWNGTSWQLLDPGDPGHVLRMGANQLPVWQPEDSAFDCVVGCADPTACNFSAEVTLSYPDLCDYLTCVGCTDPLYLEFSPTAVEDDGSCATLLAPGCTDPLYLEYDAAANQDNGSCVTPIVAGCTDPFYAEFNPLANTDDGSCSELLPAGCTDESVSNYDPAAVVDDGSCCYSNLLTLVMEDSYGDGWNGNVFVITGAADSVLFSATFYDGYSSEASVCLEDGCYLVSVELGSWIEEVSWQLLLGDAVLLEGGAPFNSTTITFGQGCASGCTDPAADNYDPSAIEDDGSCTFPPCIPVTFEGYTYDVVQIGYQCWFAENLRSDHYRNGDAIPGNLSDAEWTSTTTGAQTVYGEGSSEVYSGNEDEVANLATYGRLYNWFAVNDGRGLCPTGWQVPTDAEWTSLAYFLGGSTVAGHAMKSSSTDSPGWDGSNVSGFSALPGGTRSSNIGDFGGEGYYGAWWSSSFSSSEGAWSRSLNSDSVKIGRVNFYQRVGVSVRCIRSSDYIAAAVEGCTDLAAENYDATATEDDGSCFYTVTLSVGASDLTVECDASADAAIDAWLASNGGATAAGGCGGLIWSHDYAGVEGYCSGTGEAYVTFTAMDNCGNAASTTATLTIVDWTAPDSVVGAQDGVADCDGTEETQLSAWLGNLGGASAVDACDDDIIWSYDYYESFGDVVEYVATFTAYDGCGNATSTMATFTIDCPASIPGCTDPAAENYDPSATEDDGSCTFASTCAPVTFDGYSYEVVQIGTQCWFAENLRSDNYRNGDAIPGNLSDTQWASTTSGAQAIYYNDAGNLATYGRLYNWYAVDDARELCPTGWHVPTDGEWMALEMALGMTSSEANSTGYRGTDQGTQLKSSPSDSPSWDGSNTSGFSALPGGWHSNGNGGFNGGGYNGNWWSSSPSGSSNAWFRGLYSGNDYVSRNDYYRRGGFSVRCVRDSDYMAIEGCTDPLYLEFNPLANTDDGSCSELLPAGCTDESFSNYDPAAVVDDGSCCYGNLLTLVMEDSYGDGWNGNVFVITGAADSVLFSATFYDGYSSEASVCLEDGCYVVSVELGSWIEEVSWQLLLGDSVLLEGGAPFNSTAISFGQDCASGCTNPAADNYDPSAIEDDGSCTFSACIPVTFEGYTYDVVQIGTQCWFAENLRSDNYRNGDAIPGNLSNTQWAATTAGAQAIYNNDAGNLATYGRLYNWYAVDDARGLCPTGWHVPTDAEWMTLEMALGMTSSSANSTGWRGTDQGTQLKSSPSDSPSWNGSNTSGFSALPGGARNDNGGVFNYEGYQGYWWSSSPSGSSYAWGRFLLSDYDDVNRGNGLDRRDGLSVRCVRESDYTAIEGCTDSLYLEFNPLASVDDGSCETITIPGCTDPLYSEYDASANQDDGSCATLIVPGCTDPAAENYDPSATEDDGSCTFASTCTPVTFDGYSYEVVQIGTQCWFAENLRSDNYRNGDAIPGNLTDAEWTTITSGAQAIYNNDAGNLATYGRLYNWYAVDDARELCPTGWHVPTDAEWTTLTNFLGGSSEAGHAMKSSPSDSPSWTGSNTSGFSALPGGLRSNVNGFFFDEGYYGGWWSSSPGGSVSAWARYLTSGDGNVGRYNIYQRNGLSVRCVRDSDYMAIEGCTDPLYLEYDASANQDDGSCATLIVPGCTDPLYLEYDASANQDDGSCATLIVPGCTDPAAENYDPSATEDDGSCTFASTCTPVTFDGYSYEVVQIGTQCWFAENLRSDNYRNGDAIPGNLTDAAWTTTTSGAQAVYNNDAGNLATYGRLYNWYAVNDARGLCPTGWHVPTDAEWMTLEMALGMTSSEANSAGWRGTDQGTQLKSSPSDAPSWDGSNTSGFSALPGGYRIGYDGYFGSEGSSGSWWSSSPSGSASAWGRGLSSGNDSVSRNNNYLRNGFSVRCVRD